MEWSGLFFFTFVLFDWQFEYSQAWVCEMLLWVACITQSSSERGAGERRNDRRLQQGSRPNAWPVPLLLAERMCSYGGVAIGLRLDPHSFSTSSGILSSISPHVTVCSHSQEAGADSGCWRESGSQTSAPWTHQVSLHLRQMDFQFTVENGKLRLLNFLSNCSLSLGSFISLVSPSVSRPQVSTQMWFWVLSKKEVLAWAQLAHVLTRLNISKVNIKDMTTQVGGAQWQEECLSGAVGVGEQGREGLSKKRRLNGGLVGSTQWQPAKKGEKAVTISSLVCSF